MSACEQQAKTLVTSLETLKNPFGQDGKLTSAAVCLLNNAIQESRGKMLKKVLKDKKVAEARRVLEEQVLDVSRDRFKAASKAALAAHEQLVKSQISALQSLTRDPVKSAKLWAVLIKVAHKEIDAELLALVKELEPYLNPFSKPKSAFSSALVREAPVRPAGIVVTPEVTTKPAESALPGPWPRAWGLSLAGNLGVGLGGGFSIGFAVDPGFSVIVGVEELSFGGPIFEADMGLMANLYAQPPLDLDGPQVAISGGGAYMVGVGAGLSWSFCIPDLQPALASVIPHTSKTCDGPQIIQPQFGPLAVIPEPTLTFGPIVGIGASLQGTVGYSFELGAAGAVPPNY